MEGYRVGTKKDTVEDTGDTGMSGIFRATSRDAEGRLGQTQGHLGATQGMYWKNIRGQGKTLWNILREQEGTLEKTLGTALRRKWGALGTSQLSSNTTWPSATTPSSAPLPSTRCFRNTSSALAHGW